MKHVVRTLLPAVLLGTVLAHASFAQSVTPKFAYVDSRAILDRAPGAADIQAQLDKERQASTAKYQKMQDTLNLMIAAFQKDQATLADSVKTRRTKAIQDKQAEIEQRATEMDQQYQQRQSELVQPLMNEIKDVLEKIRSEEGYMFIFDVGQSPTIVAADKNLDITDRVVARLKPVGTNVSAKHDSTVKPPEKQPAGAKTAPAGIKKPPTP